MRRSQPGFRFGGFAVEALILVFLVALVPQIWQAEARRVRAAVQWDDSPPPPVFPDDRWDDPPREGRDLADDAVSSRWTYPDLAAEREPIARQSYETLEEPARETPPRIPREPNFSRYDDPREVERRLTVASRWLFDVDAWRGQGERQGRLPVDRVAR